jgi:ABC-type multidrug transport system ATPase subunit
MLELNQLNVIVQSAGKDVKILDDVNLSFARGKLTAVIGPSGCGKSTLLKAITGLTKNTTGQIKWDNRTIGADFDFTANDLAYVPQFGIFYEDLTVGEILTDAAVLRLGKLGGKTVKWRVKQVIGKVGLQHLISEKAKVLSGGQKRRLALAMELIGDPKLILADEVTSGLDARSEHEINLLLRSLADEGKTVLLVTHGLRHLNLYDSVVVLFGGAVIFHQVPSLINPYFQTEIPENLFLRLDELPRREWVSAWKNNAYQTSADEVSDSEMVNEMERFPRPIRNIDFFKPVVQFVCLTQRRFRLFFRNKTQIILHVLLLLIFPLLVVLFALKGLPSIQNMSLNIGNNIVELLKESLDYTIQVAGVGTLVTGLTMFQVILLSLMGSNNSAREIAAERDIFEKEKLSGLSVSAYLCGKLFFLGLLVVLQSFWMTIFVKHICHLPGSFTHQFVILGLVNLSLTTISLAVSAWSKTAEQSSLVTLYLVGFQLPLSGAVLALPDWLATITRPFIAAYWGWSGYLETLKETRFYDIALAVSHTPLETWITCMLVLFLQTIIGLITVYLGCYRSSLAE